MAMDCTGFCIFFFRKLELKITYSLMYIQGRCKVPIGIEDRRIPSGALSASSSYNSRHGPDRGRLNMVAGRGRTGAWCAQKNNAGQWLQASIHWFNSGTTLPSIVTKIV